MPADAAVLEEYRSLREEILQRLQLRYYVLALTLAGLAAITGVFTPVAAAGIPSKIVSFSYVSLLLILGALVVTADNTRQVGVIAAYIRQFIESQIPGLNWETRWHRFRLESGADRKLDRFRAPVSFGASKPLALFYGTLVVAVGGTSLANRVADKGWAALGLVPIAGACLFMVADLYLRRGRRWEAPWDQATRHP